MILATWLSEAALEEQTTSLLVIFKVYILLHGVGSLYASPNIILILDCNDYYVGSLSPTIT